MNFAEAKVIATQIEAQAVHALVTGMAQINAIAIRDGKPLVHDEAAFKEQSEGLWCMAQYCHEMAQDVHL